MSDVRMGIYRHYKGPLYQVLGLAHDANHEGRVVVLYIGLQLDAAHLGPRLAVRTVEDFMVWVAPPDHGVCPGESCDVCEPRFRYLGPVLTAMMLPEATP